MTWLSKPILARILKGVAVAWLLALFPALTPLAQANNWGEMAMVSATMGISDSRICIGEGSRGDLGCPSYAPTISPTGRINASAGLTVDSVSLTTTGTTWGYLGSSQSYLPNFSSNAISATNISATTINGIAVSALGSSSGTVISGTTTMVSGWPDALYCTGSTGSMVLYFDEYLTGTEVRYNNFENTSTYRAIFNTNGSFKSVGDAASASSWYANCNGYSISQLYAAGRAFNFIGNSGAGGGALGDRLTSGTLAVTANSATAIVSLSTNGTTWGYLGSSQSYLPNLTAAQVSSTAISTTAVQIASSTTVTACTSTNAGTLRYNSSNTALELCTGSGWQIMGVGIPAGTISAFASSTCPTGWSEYTPARGRFLRGIDNGAGNDPSGTRVPGDIQEDLLRQHSHRIPHNSGSASVGFTNSSGLYTSPGLNIRTDQEGGAETRPKNVAVTFCQFNGTSNGWNNPLSGGSTVPGGNTGQIQFNSAGAFAGSTGLTWDNAANRLTATNISATALTVNGVAITGSASGDRITSGTTSAVATASGTIDVSASLRVTGSIQVTGTIQLMSATTAPVCTAATAGTIARINGRTYECRM